MTNITVRISDELREKMRSLSDINWSEVVRRAIEERVAMEMARMKKNKEAIIEAGQQVDSIFERLRAKYGVVEYDSSKTIRYWRDRRYSATS